jgi:hypothetical protein
MDLLDALSADRRPDARVALDHENLGILPHEPTFVTPA